VKLDRIESFFSTFAARTYVPDPRTRVRYPSLTRSRIACRTGARLMPQAAASSRSGGSLVPGDSSPCSISAWIRSRHCACSGTAEARDTGVPESSGTAI
jgi:hypothetical protein